MLTASKPMRRVLLLIFLSSGGVAATVLALLLPAHLRAVNPLVLRQIGAHGQSFLETAATAAKTNPPVAKVFVHAAELLEVPGTEAVLDLLREARGDGARGPFKAFETEAAGWVQVQEVPAFNALRPARNREELRARLGSMDAKRVLLNLDLTNTTIFAPVRSAAGLPLEISVLTAAWLLEEKAFARGAREELLHLAAVALSGKRIRELEEFYINLFALAKRFSSEQLRVFVASFENLASLDAICRRIQEDPAKAPVWFSLAASSGDGRAVADYLQRFPETAFSDLALACEIGPLALAHLLARQQPVFRSEWRDAILGAPAMQFWVRRSVRFAADAGWLALAVKFALILGGGLALAWAFKYRRAAAAERYVWFPRFTWVRRGAFALVYLVLMILAGEPYLAQGGAEEQPRLEFGFSFLADVSAVTPEPSSSTKPMLDQHTILAIATFLALQGILYAICLMKLAEIRKQPLASTMKLKLLENEENLFDGGLYCGLFGTAASLILLTLGVIKPSLISAYSSTLFGILFVALVKIVHVRPYKRRLILESTEAAAA